MADYTGTKTPPEHRDCWRTPPEVFEFFNRRFNFSADVAASDENALCDVYYTEDNSALEQDWEVPTGSYVWCNPPYSNISPWVRQAAKQAERGIGCVMLVPQDQSVGWFKQAIETASTILIITGGRLAFINAATGKPVKGNNKGSQVIIWSPSYHFSLKTVFEDRSSIIRPI